MKSTTNYNHKDLIEKIVLSGKCYHYKNPIYPIYIQNEIFYNNNEKLNLNTNLDNFKISLNNFESDIRGYAYTFNTTDEQIHLESMLKYHPDIFKLILTKYLHFGLICYNELVESGECDDKNIIFKDVYETTFNEYVIATIKVFKDKTGKVIQTIIELEVFKDKCLDKLVYYEDYFVNENIIMSNIMKTIYKKKDEMCCIHDSIENGDRCCF